MNNKPFPPKYGKIVRSNIPPGKRVFISIPMTGLIRSEFLMARYGQNIPPNWTHTEYITWLDNIAPLGFLVADARNVSVMEFLKGGWEWLFFIDHDVILPPQTFQLWNERILRADNPIWGGLYFIKSVPSEPLLYAEVGNGYMTDWKMGDEVWVRYMGLGCHVIHRSILEEIWKVSPEYQVGGQKTRKVFETPNKAYFDPETNMWNVSGGTEDFFFYNRLIKEGLLGKAGWKKHQKMERPYLCDTRVFCKHIDWNGIQYPSQGEEGRFMPLPKKRKEKSVGR